MENTIVIISKTLFSVRKYRFYSHTLWLKREKKTGQIFFLFFKWFLISVVRVTHSLSRNRVDRATTAFSYSNIESKFDDSNLSTVTIFTTHQSQSKSTVWPLFHQFSMLKARLSLLLNPLEMLWASEKLVFLIINVLERLVVSCCKSNLQIY